MMISIAASRALRAAAERQREQQNGQHPRLNAPSISGQQPAASAPSRQGSSR